MSTRANALTFDFWNTLYSVDAAAMDTVRARRIRALGEILAECGVGLTEEDLQQAYASVAAYMGALIGGAHVGARDLIALVLGRFGVEAASVDVVLVAQTALEIEEASLLGPLRLLPGARETIPAIAAAGCRLGIISDTSLTPGRLLCKFLENDGLLHCFSALTFSDETGYCKPDARMFALTLTELGAEPAEAMHVGDMPGTDIAGAKAMGMVTIRCTGAVDRQEPPAADYVISDHREIPAIIDGLSSGRASR
jgi:FMN phosphatase YigB (HAD superfamily)